MTNATTLCNATLVLPDSVVRGPLHIVDGRFVEAAPGSQQIDLRNHLIFPGLINAHDHLAINNVPPLPSHGPFPNSYAWAQAFQSHFKNPAVVAALAVPETTRHWQGGLKNLLCGATTVAHHDPWHAALDDAAFPVGLLRRFGWCHSLGLAPRVGDASSPSSGGTIFLRSFRERIEGIRRRLSRRWRSRRLGPFGPPVVESFRSTPGGQPWIIHLAEGTDPVAKDEFRQLVDVGCLAANTVLVHGVGLDASDIEHVIERRAAVVWCPASNLSLLGKTLNPRRLFDARRLALGSDARVSGSRDLLDELRVAAAYSDLSPRDLLRLATSTASSVLGLSDAGTFARGQRADLIVVRDTGGDPYTTFLDLRRGDIRAVVRDGTPAIADRDFAEWFAARGSETVPVTLDQRPKIIRRSLAHSDAMALEPGLQAT